MTIQKITSAGFFWSLGAALALSGCAMTPMGPTVQVMPGPGKTFDAFQADNNACKFYAADSVKGQADAANQRAVGGALLTTVIGAGAGAALGSIGGNAGAGAAAGAALGAGGGAAFGAGNSANDQLSIQAQYDNAFSQCMYAKGEQVPGFAPVALAPMPMPSSAAVPDPLVRSTQRELIRLGYLNDVADGYAGPKTQSAIANYQQANGMSPDGQTSSRLLAKLQATPGGGGGSRNASAPSNWVAPKSDTGGSSVSASAPAAPSGWVTPTNSATAATPVSAPAAPAGWVTPKTQ